MVRLVLVVLWVMVVPVVLLVMAVTVCLGRTAQGLARMDKLVVTAEMAQLVVTVVQASPVERRAHPHMVLMPLWAMVRP